MLTSTRAFTRFPSQGLLSSLSKASFSTSKTATASKSAAPAWKPAPPTTLKPITPAAKVTPPSKQPKKDFDLTSDSDDFLVDTTPIIASTTPLHPLSRPPQPYSKNAPTTTRAPPPPLRPAATTPRPPTPTATPTTTPTTPPTTPTPATPATPAAPSTYKPEPIVAYTPQPVITPAAPQTTAVPTPTTPAPPVAPAASKAKRPAAPKQPTPNATSAKLAANAKPAAQIAQNANASPASQRAAVARDLAGRTPQQLLSQIAQLQQHNSTLQSQLVYHSAVDAIYGETGFNQLRNMLGELTEDESLALKTSGFDGDSVIHLLEARQRDLCLQFTQGIGADLSKHITSNVKRLKDQHRQSASAATATQQTLRNAGVPDAIIAGTLVGLQPHLDELQIKIVRWEKLKADIDLLLATYSANH